MHSTDLHLYTLWRQHRNAAAFNELARRHAAMVFGTCQRILRSAADAEEVAQECFEALATTAQGPDQNLGGWLHALATRRALNRLKSETRRREREQAFAEMHTSTTEVRWDDIYPLVDEAIAALPDKLREPLIRNFFEGQTHEAIAAELGISRGAVTYRITQGVERIRKHLKQRGAVASATVLAAMLTENLASAETPAALTDAIARMALAGPPTVAVLEAPTTGTGVFTWKLGALAAAALISVITGVWHNVIEDRGGEPPPLSFSLPGALPKPPNQPSEPEIESPPATPAMQIQGFSTFRTTFVGRVLDAQGIPATNAVVTLKRWFQPLLADPVSEADPLPPFSASTVTDDGGDYSFADVPWASNWHYNNGSYYFTLEAGLNEMGAFADLRTTMTTSRVHVDLALCPLQQIDGILMDAESKPVAEVSMRVWRLYEDTGSRTGGPLDIEPIWGKNSEFTLNGLTPGRYSIQAVAGSGGLGEVEAYSGESNVRIQMSAPRRIAGIVRERQSGQALPGARLIAWARPEQIHTATSDAQGHFAFDALVPAPYHVRLTMGDQALCGDPLSQIVDLALDAPAEDLVIEAYHGGTVAGLVHDANSMAPVPYCTVQASLASQANFEEGTLGWRTRADDKGRYRMQGLPSGDFTIGAEDFGAVPRSQLVLSGRTYSGLDLTIQPGIPISGRVTDERNQPAAGAWIVAPSDGGAYTISCTDEDGSFRFWWKENFTGTASVQFQAMGVNAISPPTPLISLTSKGIDDLELRLRPAGFLEGEIRNADGSPAIDAQVVVAPDTTEFPVLGYRGLPRGSRSAHNGVLDARIGTSGRFSLGPLPLGTYVLSAFPQPATLFGSAATDPDPIVMPETNFPAHAVSKPVTVGTQPEFMVIELPRELGALPDLRGVVSIAGKTVQGAQVSLGYEGTIENPAWTRTDANGEYHFKDVRPGAAILYGTYALPGKGTDNQRSVNPRNIEVLDSAETIVDIMLGTGTEVVEGVVTINGEPRAGATVIVTMGDDEHVSTTTSPDGTYIAEFVEEGPIHIVASKNSKRGEGTWNRHYTGSLSPGERLRVDFEIGSGRLEGIVSNLAEGELANVALAVGEWDTVPTLEKLGVLGEPGIVAGQVRCEADGSFAFDNLAAGTYTVMVGALIADEESETHDEATYRAALTHVEVAEGEVTDVTVALPDKNPKL